MLKHDIDGAARAYRDILKSSPRSPAAWAGLAQVELMKGRPGAAAQVADAALKLDPGSVDAQVVKAAVQIYTEPARALEEFDRLSQRIYSPSVSFGKAWAMHLTGAAYGKVLQVLEECDEWDDQAVAVLRGEALLAAGKGEKAETEYLRALELGDEAQAQERLAELRGEAPPASSASSRRALAEVVWLVR
jgi:tetratricopeptide (TPR) repeat protein